MKYVEYATVEVNIMKRILSLGIVVILILTVLSGAYAAAENQKWGFKLNVNLKDQIQPYLKVATDKVVDKLNNESSTYHIDSYNSGINGNFKLASAMMQIDDEIKYNTGEYLNTYLSFYANGTYPYVSYASQWFNGTQESKKMNISADISVIDKDISNGTIIESSAGNISQIKSYSSTYLKMHIKGKNLPLPLIFYTMVQEKSTEIHTLRVEIDLNYENDLSVESSAICLLAQVSEKFDDNYIPSTIKISDIWVDNTNITLTVNDTNHNGYLDSGDLICLHASPSYLQQLMNSSHPIDINMILHYQGKNFLMTVSVIPSFPNNSYEFSMVFGKVKPEWRDIVNETKNLPAYDNFDFTITMNLKKQTTTRFTPAIPLITNSTMNITSNTTGTYSGTINISGLQKPYMDILEAVLNTTFPADITKLNTHINGFNNGTINENLPFITLPTKILGTMQYGGENTDMVSFKLPDSDEFTQSIKLEYFYSPTKKFIVGGSIQIGPKKFDTQATSYDDAENEINSMKSVKSGGGSGLPPDKNSLLLWGIIGIIAVIIIVVAVLVLRKK